MATNRTELAEIRRFGGSAQKNSGRGKHNKGDARLHNFIVDVKEYAKSFSLSRAVWAKICTDAAKGKAEPALMICLGDDDNPIRLWVIGDQMFKEMHGAWLDKYGG